MSVASVPGGHHTLTPYIIIDGAAQALQRHADVFGAQEELRLDARRAGGFTARSGSATARLCWRTLIRRSGIEGPGKFGGSPVSLHLYLPEVDAVVAKAAAAGATVKSQPEDKFYGDRLGTIVDPFGHTWHVSTYVEDVTPEEIERRLAAMAEKG